MKSSLHPVLAYLCSLAAPRGMAAEEDRELLRRLAEQRDEEAFAVLLQRHGPMVLSLARRIAGDEQTAEDVFQATFVWLFRKGHAISRPQALSCWLHGVARRLALQARRTHRRHRQREAFARPSPPPNPLDELTAQELLTVLDEELYRLPEKYRAPLILCCLEGLSQEEAARHLGCSASAVRGRLERGRQRLRLRLAKRGLTLPAVLGGTLLLAGAISPVPAALAQATLQAATTGVGVAPAVAALIQEAMRTMFVTKLKAIGAVVLLLALTGAGAGMMALHPQAAKENAPPVGTNDKPLSVEARVDRYGDPLPEGAVMRLGTLQRRAVGAQLVVTADGKSIVSVRGGKYITIWDTATGKRRQSRHVPSGVDTANDHGDSCALSPDSRFLATSTITDGKVTVWDVRSGKVVRELVIEKAEFIINIAFSPDGERLAADGRIGGSFSFGPAGNHAGNESIQMLRVWQLSSGKEIFAANPRHNWTSEFLDFSRDGKLLIVSHSSAEVGTCCWDLAGQRLRWQNKAFIASSLLVTPDGKLVSLPQKRAFDLATGKDVEIEHMPMGAIGPAALSPDGKTLVFSTAQGIAVWDMARGKTLRTLAGAGEQILFLPDGKSIIANDGSLQRWDLASGKPLWADTFALGHASEVVCLAFSADGRRLASGSTDGSMRLWDAQAGRPLRVWLGHNQEPSPLAGSYAGVRTLDISADGRRVVSAGNDECLKLWDAASNKEVRVIPLPTRGNAEPERIIHQVRISSDGKRVIGFFAVRANIGVPDQLPPNLTDQVAVWEAETGTLLELHSTGKRSHDSGVFSPDGRTLLVGNVLFDVGTAKKGVELPGRGKSGEGRVLSAAAFSGDGALVVSDAEKRTTVNGTPCIGPDGVYVWETATGNIVARLKTTSWVAQTAFHPDNRFIATNDLDGIHLRDLRSGEIIARFRMPEAIRAGRTPGSFAACLAFTRDGRRLATGHPDSTILLWDVPAPPSRTIAVSAKELESLWTELADADAGKAWRAVWRLADAPQDALTFLRSRIKLSPAPAADVLRQLLADLDDDSFQVREAATKRLKELGQQAEPALRAALAAKPSPEQRRRIESLLAAWAETPQPLTPEELRQLRALIVLERIGSPEARRLLEQVAKGPESRLTRQARATLMCLWE